MLNLRFAMLFSAVLFAAGVFVGCSGQNADSPSGGQATEDWKAGLDEDVIAGLSALSDADRTEAIAQKVCPVTDKQLGSMGAPPQVTVEGQRVFLCCGACEDEIKSNPDKYLAKMNAKQ